VRTVRRNRRSDERTLCLREGRSRGAPGHRQLAAKSAHDHRQARGWPLNIFLNPRGEPFWGGTYFPREESFDGPPSRQYCAISRSAIANRPTCWRPMCARFPIPSTRPGIRTAPASFDINKLDRVAIATAQNCDIFYGGIVGGRNFPTCDLGTRLALLLRTGMLAIPIGHATLARQYGRGGIYDHVGGGFARYAIDDQWLIPHFEKMLYDKRAAPRYHDPVGSTVSRSCCAARSKKPIAWALREMRVEGAGFASSWMRIPKRRGTFYVWTEAEIDAVLAGTPVSVSSKPWRSREGNFPMKENRPGAMCCTASAILPLDRTRRPCSRSKNSACSPCANGARAPAATIGAGGLDGLMIASIANAGAALSRPD